MDLDTQKAYDETVVSWLENAIEHAHTYNQTKVLFYLGCVRNELTEMRHETELATRP